MLYEVSTDDLTTREKAADDDVEIIWAREQPGARRPAYSRDSIAEAALKVADEEGFAALSMRRVAKELGAGTMTLYHYVRNKNELITLMSDRMMGEIVIPDDEVPSDWREALIEIAHRSLNAFRNHPWAIENMQGGDGGPNGMRHFEQSLKAVENIGSSPMERLEIVSFVDDYVFGFAIRESRMGRFDPERGQETGHDIPEDWSYTTLQYFEQQLKTGKYPHIAALRGEGTTKESIGRISEMVTRHDRFDRGLSRLLDGIEASLPK